MKQWRLIKTTGLAMAFASILILAGCNSPMSSAGGRSGAGSAAMGGGYGGGGSGMGNSGMGHASGGMM